MNFQLSEASSRTDLRSPTFTRLRKGTTVGWLRVVTLILLDSVLLSVAWQTAEILGTPKTSPWSFYHNPVSLLPVVGVIIGVLIARGLYQPGEMRRDYLAIVQSITLAEGLLLLIAFFHAPDQFVSRSHFLFSWILSILLICVGRFTVDAATSFLRQKGAVRYPVFLISDPANRAEAVDLVNQEKRYNILGLADASALDRNKREETFANIRRLGVAEAFVSWDAIKNRLFLCWHFQTAGITLHILPIGIEPLLKGSQFWVIGGSPSLTFPAPVISGIDFGLKRGFDFCCSLLLLVLLSPVMLLIALLIKLDSPGPVFYKQTRIGLHSQPFKAWKFRTMVVNADKLQKELEARNEMKDGIMFKIKDDPRITRVGKFLRRYSLDELPQLFNVLFGEMSLVGPRPFPMRDVEKFSERHFIRHEVLPGITGLWQVSGRSEITDFEQVIYWDLSYIEKWSIWLDLQILFRTVQVVLNKTGAY
jgi:exopolysaccharide biosynthesis polyprenyl glycosylphosphotransferase